MNREYTEQDYKNYMRVVETVIWEKNDLFWIFIIMNRSYSKIRHIQESNQNLEKRMLNERNPSTVVHRLTVPDAENMMKLNNLSSDEVRKSLSDIPETMRYIEIMNCEFADFTGINLCELPDLRFVYLKGTESNFNEQGYYCSTDLGGGIYDMEYEKPKETGFSEPSSSTDIYGKYNYSFK